MSKIIKPNMEQIIQDAWLGIEVDPETLFNPLNYIYDQGGIDDFADRLAWLFMQPEYFYFACKYILGIEITPFQSLLLKEMWNRKFPMLIGSRGMGKSFILSVYPILRALFIPGRKVTIVGAAFRQSKVLFEYMDTIWRNAPILRDLCDSSSGPKREVDRCVMKINGSVITALPLGDGQKIRGQRANDIVADEFATIPRDIFENVVAGFAAVSASPIENVKYSAAKRKAEELGIELEKSEVKTPKESIANQIIISGTAYYDFNHFADYWKRYKKIINTEGKKKNLEEMFGGPVPKDFNWTDYAIMRIPFEMLPDGFMDKAQVARSKATIHSGIYQMEYGACFTTDSQGFFRRSLIESCVANKHEPVKLPSGDVWFNAVVKGNPNKKYVYGIDPASEVDNFSIVVLELESDHRRIVYCWTTNRQRHKEQIKKGLTNEDDFYSYCARKIRDLMKIFPCEEIALDAQGGGIAVMEALHDKDKIREGEVAIWPKIDEKKWKDTDGEAGLHIVELCQFARGDWLAECNHGLRKDMEDKILLFPYFDSASLGLALEDDKRYNRVYDTLEDCVMEIEELKDELAMIVVTVSDSGRERWDTPQVKAAGSKKGRLRKDRYSSLIIANMSARQLMRAPEKVDYDTIGGFAGGLRSDQDNQGPMYHGPSWFTEKISKLY